VSVWDQFKYEKKVVPKVFGPWPLCFDRDPKTPALSACWARGLLAEGVADCHSTWSLIQKPQLSQHAHTRGRPWAGLGSVCDTPCDCQLADIKCVVRFLSIKVPGTIILLELDTCNGHILQNPSSLSTTRLGAVERHLLGVSQALPLTHR